MGCTLCAQEHDLEESLIKKCEEGLGYKKLKCEDIDISFHRFCYNLQLTNMQFIESCQQLNIDLKDISKPSSPLVGFYEFFKTEDGMYCTRKLSTLGVLLGKGSTHEKAEILFKNYDIEISDTLDNVEMKILITDVLNISMNFLPWYALNTIDDKIYKEILDNYWKTLKKLQGKRTRHYEKLLIRDKNIKIKIDEFITMFDYESIKCLVNSSKLRTQAIKDHTKED